MKKIINFVNVQDNYIIIQPIKEGANNKKLYKITRKIKEICTKGNVQNIVVSKQLQENKEFMAYIYAYKINTFDGKWLLNYMAYEIIDFIMQKTKEKKEKLEITILVNNITNEILENIKLFAKVFKRINIVTNFINKFKYLEKKIYDEYGMMITVTNNKRKSLERAKMILNYDFSNEVINQFSIYENATIINFRYNIQIKKKRFNGVIINNYEISSIHENDDFEFERLNCFYLKDLLEAKLYRKDTFESIRGDIIQNYYKIKELYGINGKVFL